MTMTTSTKSAFTLAAILALTTAVAAPALASGRRARTERVTGSFPQISMTYAPWDNLQLMYPRFSNGSMTYVETFRVDDDDALRALIARVGSDNANPSPGSMNVGVTLERTVGATTWHVVKVGALATMRP